MQPTNKKQRYEVKSWVCDYGVWDNKYNQFVGDPFYYNANAQIVCFILNLDDTKIVYGYDITFTQARGIDYDKKK